MLKILPPGPKLTRAPLMMRVSTWPANKTESSVGFTIVLLSDKTAKNEVKYQKRIELVGRDTGRGLQILQ